MTRAQLIAALTAQTDVGLFQPSVRIPEMLDYLEAGGQLERELKTTQPAATPVSGTSWQELAIWETATPNDGGRGLKKHLVLVDPGPPEVWEWDGTHWEVEEGGDGFYLFSVDLSCEAPAYQTQWSIRRTRAAAHSYWRGVDRRPGFPIERGPAGIVGVQGGDLIALVCRTEDGQDADPIIWAASMYADRRLATG